MEEWEFEFEWLRTRHAIKKTMEMDALPDIQGILLVIGIHTLGKVQEDWTKEEKQDLMHIAVCKVLSYGGFYSLDFVDQEGWPHWKLEKELPHFDLLEQEKLLKLQVIEYFEKEYQLEI